MLEKSSDFLLERFWHLGALELVRLHTEVTDGALGMHVMESPEIVPVTRATLHRLSPLLSVVSSGHARRADRLCHHEAVPVLHNRVEHLPTEPLRRLQLSTLLAISLR